MAPHPAHLPALQPALQGVNVTALREVKFLRELNSPHVVRLLDVFPQKRGISLVGGGRGGVGASACKGLSNSSGASPWQ